MDKAAAFYEEEAQHSTVQLVTILSVVLLIVAAILVAIKMISFYTGFYGGVTGAGNNGTVPNPAPNGIHAPAGGDTGE